MVGFNFFLIIFMEKVQERVYDFCSVTFTLLVLSVSVVHDLVQLGLLLHKALSLSPFLLRQMMERAFDMKKDQEESVSLY